jgi:hypothetical protein
VVSVEGLTLRGRAQGRVREQLQRAFTGYVAAYIAARKRADITI